MIWRYSVVIRSLCENWSKFSCLLFALYSAAGESIVCSQCGWSSMHNRLQDWYFHWTKKKLMAYLPRENSVTMYTCNTTVKYIQRLHLLIYCFPVNSYILEIMAHFVSINQKIRTKTYWNCLWSQATSFCMKLSYSILWVTVPLTYW